MLPFRRKKCVGMLSIRGSTKTAYVRTASSMMTHFNEVCCVQDKYEILASILQEGSSTLCEIYRGGEGMSETIE
jgi:hypothetical protein